MVSQATPRHAPGLKWRLISFTMYARDAANVIPAELIESSILMTRERLWGYFLWFQLIFKSAMMQQMQIDDLATPSLMAFCVLCML